MTKFRIDYVDPSTGQPASETVEREDIPKYATFGVDRKVIGYTFYSAKSQAWDFGYLIAKKGHFEVVELKI